MEKYYVNIVETLTMTVEVEAESEKQAEELAEKGWLSEQYVLDSSNFNDVSFVAAGLAND